MIQQYNLSIRKEYKKHIFCTLKPEYCRTIKVNIFFFIHSGNKCAFPEF